MSQLTSSSTRLTGLIRNLSPAQWGLHPTANAWSIGEIARHVMDTEVPILNNVEILLAGPTAPLELCEAVQAKETKLLRAVPERSRRVQMHGRVRPRHRCR